MSRPAGFSDSDEDSDFEQFGFEPNRRTNHVVERVWTPEEKLFEAVRKNDVTAVLAALADGADIHYRMGENSPIMVAASEGNFAVMEALVQNGANVNDEHKMTTVLMCICMSWSKNEDEVLSCLLLALEHGADPKATNWTSTTPIMMATRNNHILLVKHLVEIGCDINAGDPDGITPLMIAFQNENVAMAKYLIEIGANINAVDRRGNRLVDIPQVSTNPELASLLGIQLDEIEDDEIQQPVNLSSYKMAMANAPNKNDRLHGYHKDAVRFVAGMGLYDVARLLEDKDIQLAQLLTWDEEELDKNGVEISYYRQKIANSVKKYHEQPWGRNGVPNVDKIKSEDEVDLFLVVLHFFDFLRVQHISSATSLFMLKNLEGPLGAKVEGEIKDNLASLSSARHHLQLIKQTFLKSAAKSVPPDLITKKKPRKQNFLLNFIGLSFGIIFVGSSLRFFIKHN